MIIRKLNIALKLQLTIVTRNTMSSVVPSPPVEVTDTKLKSQPGNKTDSQPAQRLKQILVSVQGPDTRKAVDGDAASPPVTTSEAQPQERPANILHELYPKSELQIADHHIDDVRSLNVVIIGAGLSGILAGILLPVKVPKIRLTILEKNDDVVSYTG